MPGIAFDQAAEYYDATRGLAEGVAEKIRDAIVAETQANVQTRFLELGVGTGRIALPFMQGGYNYTGVDLSLPMMNKLADKLEANSGKARSPYQLLLADILRLPFADDSFEVALAVHVFHLVENWQEALDEAYRVLRKPGGQLFVAYDSYGSNQPSSATGLVNKQWDEIFKELGYTRSETSLRFSEGEMGKRLEGYVQRLGAETRSVVLVEHTTPPLSPRAMAQRHADRMYSSDWRIPEEIHAEAVRRLQTWLDTECPNPDQPISITAQFKALVAKW